MKTISKLFLFVILLGVMLLNTTCSNSKLFGKVTFEGYVYDSLGGKPIRGIWVSLSACDGNSQDDQCESYPVGQAQTDVSGHFYIRDDAARSNRYAVALNGSPIGGLNYGNDANWLKANFSMIYLNKIP